MASEARHVQPGFRAARLVVAAALLLGVLSAGCGGEGGGAEGSNGGEAVAYGEKLYRPTCGMCHGLKGEGQPALGKSLVASEFIGGRSDEELVAFLIEGRPTSHPDNERGVAMPPRGGNPSLTDEDLAAIVGYLRTLQ